MSLSVIVPVLNEAAGIRDFIFQLRERLPAAEVILVDGGSNDETWNRLERLRDELSLQLIASGAGRARQMNAGARRASAETFLFLHADSRLPAGCEAAIVRLLADARLSGGCFRLQFPRHEWIYRVSDSLGNLAVDLFQIALGDHGIFCRRQAFLRAGGFPDLPLMEDAEFYRALRRQGRVRQLPSAIETSARRYEELGRYRTTLFYLLILLAYLLRVSPVRLAQWHGRFTHTDGAQASRRPAGEGLALPTGRLPILQRPAREHS